MADTRAVGLTLAPTFVAFTPWTTLEGYCDLLQTIDRLGLVEHVSPIQLAIRLLVTEGSRLLELPDVRAVTQPFSPRSLTYPWVHVDPRVDELQKRVEAFVGVNLSAPRRELFARVWALAHDAAGVVGRAVRRARHPGAGGHSLSQRTLVLLSGAHVGAGCSDLGHGQHGQHG